jgi:hypothetical protein
MERPIGDCKIVSNPAECQMKPLFPIEGQVLSIFSENAIIALGIT